MIAHGITDRASVTPESDEVRIRRAHARRREDDRYSMFNPGHLFTLQERERAVLKLLKQQGAGDLAPLRILEVGCGTGTWMRDFVRWGARPEHMTGVDILPERIAQARGLCPAKLTLLEANATSLPFDAASFDLVLQSTVFTSILNEGVRQAVALEMIRVTRDTGLMLWYDYHVQHRANPDTRPVSRTEIRRLFPECTVRLTRITLAPPIVRLIAPYSWFACECLGALPLARTHYLGAIHKNSCDR